MNIYQLKPGNEAIYLHCSAQCCNHSIWVFSTELLEAPVDQVVFPETNATFFCHGRGTVDWAVNNTFLLNNNTINEFRERGFVQNKVRSNPGNTPSEYNIFLTALGSLENNNTNVTCRAYGSDPGGDNHTATLIVAGTYGAIYWVMQYRFQKKC